MKGIQLGGTATATVIANIPTVLTIPLRSDGASARACHVSWVTSNGSPPGTSIESVTVGVYSDGNTVVEEMMLPYEEPMILYTGGCDRIQFQNYTLSNIQVYANAMDHE